MTTATTEALVLFVLVDNFIENAGTPYYLIWLTNWTGLLTGAYAATFMLATWQGLKHNQDSAAPAHARGARGLAENDCGDWIPRSARALWYIKASAPSSQILITLMYWGVLYDPAYVVKASNAVAHGGLCFAMVLDLACTSRMPFGKRALILDVACSYAFLCAYLLFNVVYTTAIPGAKNDDGQPYVYEILAWRTHPLRSFAVVLFVALGVAPVSFGIAAGLAKVRDGYLFKVETDALCPPMGARFVSGSRNDADARGAVGGDVAESASNDERPPSAL